MSYTISNNGPTPKLQLNSHQQTHVKHIATQQTIRMPNSHAHLERRNLSRRHGCCLPLSESQKRIAWLQGIGINVSRTTAISNRLVSMQPQNI